MKHSNSKQQLLSTVARVNNGQKLYGEKRTEIKHEEN